MKNKKMTYVLLPLVMIVWGIVFFKIFSAIKPSSAAVSDMNIIKRGDDSSLFKVDTFSIVNNYRDPFNNKPSTTNKSGTSHNVPVKKKVVVTNTPLKWPEIVYNGIIKNKNSPQQLVMVKINGASNFMTKGENIAGVQLLKVYKDSIVICYSGEKRTVRK
jgi:type II secretory pathway component PulC